MRVLNLNLNTAEDQFVFTFFVGCCLMYIFHLINLFELFVLLLSVIVWTFLIFTIGYKLYLFYQWYTQKLEEHKQQEKNNRARKVSMSYITDSLPTSFPVTENNINKNKNKKN